MTNEPNPGEENRPDSNQPQRDRRRWRRVLLPLSAVTVAGLAGGLWWGWVFVHEQLAPLVEKNLSQTVKRPVKLGRVERFTLTSLRFGPSEVPATPTDSDRLTIEQIDVAFNPLQVLLTRTLRLDITIDKPSIYLEQTKDGTWISTQISQEESEGPIKTEIDAIRFRDAAAVLVPWAKYGNKQGKPVTLQQTDGTARFFDNNKRVSYELDGRSTTGGELHLEGESLLGTPLQTKLQLRAQNFLLSEVDRLVKLPVDLQTGRVNSGLSLELVGEEDPLINGSAQFQGVTLRIPNTPTPFTQAKGSLQLKGTRIQLENVNTLYGKVPVVANGSLDTKAGFNLSARVKPVSLPTVIDTLKLQVPVPLAGEVMADLKVTGAIDKPVLSGTARNTKQVRVDQINLSRLSTRFRLDVTGQKLTVPSIRAVPVAGGLVTGAGIVNIAERPTLAFEARVVNVPADPIARAYGASNAIPFAIGPVNADVRIAGPADALVVTIPTARIAPSIGGVLTASGRIPLSGNQPIGVQFQAVNLPGDAIARAYNNGAAPPITVGLVNAQGQVMGSIANPQAVVNWQAPQATYAARGQVIASRDVITLRDTVLSVAGGTVRAQARLAAGRWQAIVSAAQVPLRQFSQDLRGLFSGDLTLAGTSFRPADVRAEGQVRFSEGIAVIQAPLTAQIRWDGQKVVLQDATAPGFNANGFLYAQLEGRGAPGLSGFDLNVRVSDYSLQAFAVPLPANVQYSGRADFNGRISGTPTAPRVNGNLALRQFVFNDVAFDPVLSGTVRVDRGVNLNLVGQQDRIAAQLDAAYRPVAFEIRRGEAVATGRTQGELLLVEARNFPATFLGPFGQTQIGTISGELNGNLAVNLNNYNVSGDLAIANPAIGGYRADQFGGRISFANGVATLTGAELRRGQSIFQLNGTATLQGDNPQVKAQLKVAQGNIQDVLELAQLFELSDLQRGVQQPAYGSQVNLTTVPVELTDATILDQLRRLSEVKALLEQEYARRQEAPIPELRELQGTFNGEVNVVGSPRAGFNANFNIQGESWTWGPYQAKQVVAIGSFENGTLTLLPVRLQSDDSFIAFSGQVGGEGLSGQVRVEKVPVVAVKELIDAYLAGQEPLPLNIEGQLSATATLSGSLQNPQAIGSLELQNAILNNTDVQDARGSFQYANARLNFSSSVLVTGNEPLTVVASFPYKLPFATVAPDSDQIQLDINVRNEGLALLNVLNNQVAWLDGQGEVRLTATGTLAQPQATGYIRVANAKLQSRALPEPLTDVNGTISFQNTLINVEALEGQYSKGRVSAKGVLPIFGQTGVNEINFDQSIAVTLDQIDLNLKGLYRGGVNGSINVAGSALNPVIAGSIVLANGEVQLSQPSNGEGTGAGGTAGQPEEGGSNVLLSDLKLQLGDRIRVTQAPLINFVAKGDLTINGSLDDLRPSGTINLTAGQVNLFTTQFTLARGYPQTAEFRPGQGLDPNLNVRLIALVPEVTNYRQPSNLLPSEILDTPPIPSTIGGVQTVRVRAEVQGPASQLVDNLELTSNPPRSESEIVALIGGGFVQTLGRGDSALGIANLAGSALLTNVQTVIGNALGLSEFRIFPTLTREDKSRSSALGLAAEAAIDITPSLSFGTLFFLTSDQAAQFGLRYRVNDNLLVRTSTDLSGDVRAVVEYEARF